MTYKNGYKAVFFDLDGTLRHNVPSSADSFDEKVRELGMTVSDESARAAGRWEHRYWANSDQLHEDSQTYANNEDAFWKNYTQRRLSALGATAAQIAEYTQPIRLYMRKEYKSKDWVPPELHEILPSLREAGFKLGVLSNRSKPFMKEMKKLKLANYFEYIKAAGELGAWKPNPVIFESLIEHFNVLPEESIYIGDNYYADVVGARAAGLEPILYDPRGIFPDADCTRITSFDQLAEIL